MSSVVVPILVIAALIILNGLFVAAEFAIVGARKTRVDAMAKGNPAARVVSRILSSPRNQDRYIAIAQLGITLATIGLGMYGEPAIASWLYSPLERWFGLSTGAAHTIGTILAVLVMTYFHVVIGEMIPKALALQSPERVAVGISLPMRIVGTITYPLVALLNGIGNGLLRLIGVAQEGSSRLYSSAELLQLVEESSEEGVVSAEEGRLIRNILDFSEREVQEVMVPRTRTIAVPLDADPEEVLELMSEHGYSRYPVYRKDIDDIVGVVHVRDLIEREVRGQQTRLANLLRRAPRVPESTSVEALLGAFKRLQVHLAIVIDEHGGTAGIVTLEDLLEEVVGEVEDEADLGDQPEIEELGDGSFSVAGTVSLYHFNEALGTEIESQESNTIAGVMLEQLGRAPEVGDQVAVDGVKLSAEEVDGLAILRLHVAPLESDEAEGEDQSVS